MVQRRGLPGPRSGSWMAALIVGGGTVLSAMWLILIARYVHGGPGWDNLMASHPTDFAVFLAASAAPLAALWLIVGALLHVLALGGMRAAIRDTERQALRTSGDIESLIRTSIEMQEQARRQSFLNGAEMAIKDLNSQAGLIAGRIDILSAQETEYLWALNAAGDPWAFCHAVLERTRHDSGFMELMARRVADDDVSSAALQRFLRRYDRLVTLAQDHDADRLVREVLEDGPMDRLYVVFQAVSGRVQALLDQGSLAEPHDRGQGDWPSEPFGGPALRMAGQDADQDFHAQAE